MTTLPPPNVFDSGACHVPPTPDEAAARNDVLQTVGATVSARGDDIDSKQKLLAAIEDDYRFVLDEEKFLFDIGFVPDDFAKYMAMIEQLTDDDEPPLFIQQQRRA